MYRTSFTLCQGHPCLRLGRQIKKTMALHLYWRQERNRKRSGPIRRPWVAMGARQGESFSISKISRPRSSLSPTDHNTRPQPLVQLTVSHPPPFTRRQCLHKHGREMISPSSRQRLKTPLSWSFHFETLC